MIFGTMRHVLIRGYIMQVTVLSIRLDGEYNVKTEYGQTDTVPAHLFFHNHAGGLLLRDSVEFQRKYPAHPIDIVNLPAL